ncbi:hypothetical protein KIPB_009308, partial [Kipferlia bialata]|eukprot:g9308.t1
MPRSQVCIWICLCLLCVVPVFGLQVSSPDGYLHNDVSASSTSDVGSLGCLCDTVFESVGQFVPSGGALSGAPDSLSTSVPVPLSPAPLSLSSWPVLSQVIMPSDSTMWFSVASSDGDEVLPPNTGVYITFGQGVPQAATWDEDRCMFSVPLPLSIDAEGAVEALVTLQ